MFTKHRAFLYFCFFVACFEVPDFVLAQGDSPGSNAKAREQRLAAQAKHAPELKQHLPSSIPYKRAWEQIEFDPRSAENYSGNHSHLTNITTFICFAEYGLHLCKVTQVQQKLGLKSSQLEKLKNANKKVAELRLQVRDGLRKKKGDVVATKNYLAKITDEIEVISDSVFTDDQRTMLNCLSNHLHVKFSGISNTMAMLPGITEFDLKLEEKDLREIKYELAREGREIAKSLGSELKGPEKFNKGLHFYWLRDFVDEELLKEVISEYLQRPYRSQALVDLYEMASIKAETTEQSLASLSELWCTKGSVRLSTSGLILRHQEKLEGMSGVEILVDNLLRQPMVDRLEIIDHQQQQLETMRKELSKLPQRGAVSEMSDTAFRDFFAQVLLPHQCLLLEREHVWREVDTYGFTASVLRGRLKELLKLNNDSVAKLKSTSNQTAIEFEDALNGAMDHVFVAFDKYFEKEGMPPLCEAAFGSDSWSILDFEREK